MRCLLCTDHIAAEERPVAYHLYQAHPVAYMDGIELTDDVERNRTALAERRVMIARQWIAAELATIGAIDRAADR